MGRFIVGIILFFHSIGNIIQKQSNEGADHKRKQEKAAKKEAKPRQKTDDGIHPAIFKFGNEGECLCRAKTDQNKYARCQCERFYENRTKCRITELSDGFADCRKQCTPFTLFDQKYLFHVGLSVRLCKKFTSHTGVIGSMGTRDAKS